jgi:hypothetical protein
MQLKIILNIFVLLLICFGIISLTVIIQGYFGHMTSSGNEDKDEAAKHRMITGAICLAVVMALFTAGRYFIKNTDFVMAENEENFDQIYTNIIE